MLRALARCPDANGALCDACLDACADSLFTHPHADVLHVHCADVLLAVIDRKPLHAHAAKRLERLLFRDNSTEGGLLSRIRATLTGLERPKNSRDAHLVVAGEAVCAALREDEAKPGAGLVPDLLYARRNELDAWLHFVEDLARLTARKVAADFAVPLGAVVGLGRECGTSTCFFSRHGVGGHYWKASSRLRQADRFGPLLVPYSPLAANCARLQSSKRSSLLPVTQLAASFE